MFHWKVSTGLVGVCLFVLNHFIWSSRANAEPESSSPAVTAGKMIAAMSWAGVSQRITAQPRCRAKIQGHVWQPRHLSPCVFTSRPKKRHPNIKIKQSHTTLKPSTLHLSTGACMLLLHTGESTTDQCHQQWFSGINRWSSSKLEFNCTDPLLWAALLLLGANLCIHWPSTKLVQGVSGQSIPALHWTATTKPIVHKSLSKGERLKGSYSSPQRCQSPVPPPSWTWGRCLAGAACWPSRAPSASWSSLPSADPTGLHNKKEIKESVSKPEQLSLVKDLPAQAPSFGLHYSCSGQSLHALTSTKWVPQAVSGQSKSQLQLCDPQIKPPLCFTVPKHSLQTEVW